MTIAPSFVSTWTLALSSLLLAARVSAQSPPGSVEPEQRTETDGASATPAAGGPASWHEPPTEPPPRVSEERVAPEDVSASAGEREKKKSRQKATRRTARVAPGDRVPPPSVQAPKRFAGIAEVGIGWFLLPGATVCGDPNAECERGDTTPTLEIWNLVRLPIGFAFGAGLTLGLLPTADVPPNNPPGVDRSHRRGYMTVEGIARYYPFQGETVEGWVGMGPGLVIVSDNYSSRAGISDNAYVGNPGVTLFTEGLSLLAGLGISVSLTEHWYLGAGLRGGLWRVPDEPERSPLGDEASITGTNGVLYGGINVAFRAKL